MIFILLTATLFWIAQLYAPELTLTEKALKQIKIDMEKARLREKIIHATYTYCPKKENEESEEDPELREIYEGKQKNDTLANRLNSAYCPQPTITRQRPHSH